MGTSWLSKSYTPTQVQRLVLAALVLISSLGLSVAQVQTSQASNLPLAAVSQVVPTAGNGQVQFSSNAYTATEGQPGTTVTVNRVNGTTGPITVSVRISDVTTTPARYQGISSAPAGTLDTTFAPAGTGPDNDVNGVAVQPNGKILIVGSFNNYNGTGRKYIARLNTDGSLDTTFAPIGTGPDSVVYGVAVQTDGKIMIAGDFTNYNGVARNSLARLNADGTLDNTFAPAGTGPNDHLGSVTIQPDGKFVISGVFTSYNGVARPRLARLLTNGALDTTFAPAGTGPNDIVKGVAVQPDGKIIIGGVFTNYNNNNPQRAFLARLNLDGTLDNTFIPPNNGPDSTVTGVAVEPGGKVLIAGFFGHYGPTAVPGIARLNSDGTLDTAFTQAGTGPAGTPNGFAYGVAVQPTDGKIVVGGSFTQYNGVARNRVARLYGTGTVTLSWANGDAAPKSFVITATNDTVSQPTQTATLDLTDLQGGVTLGAPATATLTVVDNDPGQLLLTGGNNQSAAVNTAFAQPLSAQVKTQAGDPVASVLVTFTAPATGASGTFVGGSRIYSGQTDAAGFITTTTFTANALTGSYSVSAVVTAVANPLNYALTNTLVGTTLALTSSPNPSNIGQTVTFTATVSPVAATGTVTFTEGATVLGTAALVNGTAIFTTNGLSVGTHSISATYGGSTLYAGSTSQTVNQVVGCPLVVTSTTDDGSGTTCGTLSYALSQPYSGTTPITISFALTQGNTITFTGSLSNAAALKPYVVLDGGANGRIILEGNEVAGDGLHLGGNNFVRNITIRHFAGRQLVTDGPGNRLQGVVASRT